jgi:hypothetical protein
MTPRIDQPAEDAPHPVTLGVSLKMCFGRQQTLDWCRSVADIARRHEAVTSGAVEPFVLPSSPLLTEVLGVLGGTQWAIGASEPVSPEHIRHVCRQLAARLTGHERLGGSRVIYGGSAGPGLLGRLAGSVDGLCLGRFAHDPRALEATLDEALTVRGLAVTR